MKYRIILFDADGTLLDFSRAEEEALCEALESMGISHNGEMLSTYSKINISLWKALERGEIDKNTLRPRRFKLFFEHYGIDKDERAMASAYENALSKRGYLLDGAKELCERLCGKARLFIVTNGIDFIQIGRYERCGLAKYFDDIFISGCIGYEKPDVRYFEHVAKQIPEFSKNSAVIIGDSLTSDIQGGLNFGIDTCWYNPNGKDAPADMPITHSSRDFNDIYRFVTDGE